MIEVDLSALGLTAEAIQERKDALGGSDANTLMSGDEERIVRLYLEKRGEAEPEDLSDKLAVQMGSFTEPFNVAWFCKMTGLRVVGRGAVLQANEPAFMRCTLDGLVCSLEETGNGAVTLSDPLGVYEAKHCGTFDSDAELFARYCPQLTHNCLVTGQRRAWLSIFRGNADWVLFEYELDDAYAARLVEAERAFWDCVIYGTPPYEIAEPEPRPKPVGVVEYDMTGSNMWGHWAGEYLDTILASERHDDAREALKELVPEDASRCFGYGLQIKRDKRGALRFSVEKGD